MMAYWNTKHPLHVWSGWLTIAGCLCATAAIAVKRPEAKEASLAHGLFHGARGEKGRWTTILPRGEYTLVFETSEGDEKTVRLKGVAATYTESPPNREAPRRTLIWHIAAPTASHDTGGAVDTLYGPLSIEVRDANGALLGSGTSDHDGPALRRESDVWFGMAPLHWIQMGELGQGEYFLPAGWRKERDDSFVADQGPIEWRSMGTGIVRNLTAGGLNAKDMASGVLDDVRATLAGDGALGGGQIWAERVEVEGASLRFLAPVRFEHQHGWQGSAAGGAASGPAEPGSHGTLDLEGFEAHGFLGAEFPNENLSKVNVRKARADRAQWGAAGLRMEGNVQWDLEAGGQNGAAMRYLLAAQKAFYRSGPGGSLPESVAIGTIRSEGAPRLTWGGNALSSPSMAYHVAGQTWHLEGPVTGTVPGGSFSSGAGAGSASGWAFNGPIRADYQAWGILQGSRLSWDEKPGPAYTFMGHPATLAAPGHRLSGEKIIRSEGQMQFPSGIQGSITFRGEAFTLRADSAEMAGNRNTGQGGAGANLMEIRLSGRVECSAQGYRFSSKEATISFDGNRPRRITAGGGISLEGSLGSGVGDALELIFEQDGAQPRIKWSGRARGKIEVPLDR